MKVRCISNQGIECLLTEGKVYIAMISTFDSNYFIVVGDNDCANAFEKSRFEVIPSIDDIIKDKEKEGRL